MIKLSSASLGSEEKEAVDRVLDAKYLGMGQEVMLFESELEAFFSHKTRVACVNTGTSALQLALQACGIGQGDEVLIPSLTYVASFQAASATGATPIACDIDLKNGCLDFLAARKKLTPRTKAVMYVHYGSGIGDRERLFSFAHEFGLRVIEDAAHSFGGYDKGERIGERGDILCFSFDGIKNITCGEGGAVVSSDEKVIDKIRDLRLLGVQKDTEQRYAGKRSWDFDVTEQGWRYHMSNMNAAIGRAQLKKIDGFGKKRRSLAQVYKQHLQGLPIECLDIDLDNSVPHIFPVLVEKGKRTSLRDFLLSHHIETGVHYKPNHLLTKYRSHDCPQAEAFGERILSLPLHVGLDEGEIIRVSQSIGQYFA